MTSIALSNSNRNPELWRLAESAFPRSTCGCGAPVWQHWYWSPDYWSSLTHCEEVHDAPEVEAEYRRLVAESVADALTAAPPTPVNGFASLHFNSAKIVPSKYAPGTPSADGTAKPGAVARVALDDCDGKLTAVVHYYLHSNRTADLSWGADLRNLRRYLRRRIVPPPSSVPRLVRLPVRDNRIDALTAIYHELRPYVGDPYRHNRPVSTVAEDWKVYDFSEAQKSQPVDRGYNYQPRFRTFTGPWRG